MVELRMYDVTLHSVSTLGDFERAFDVNLVVRI